MGEKERGSAQEREKPKEREGERVFSQFRKMPKIDA